ncbi:hypothetical protein FOL47_002250 [Perkinsus chesapeaki]|uniref:subtilisin n=1 Tax=Perkinsus chesapeaki TaxID=330153 RepID=A0A7J6N0C0_PERCH|nr:hypothetical protein FOL47_002250 [Perkinsus chesapeaki]
MWFRCFIVVYLLSSSVASKVRGEDNPHHVDRDETTLADDPPVNDFFYPLQALYFEAINIPEAWRLLAKVKRKRVAVAVIDTGVEAKHPDLLRNLIEGYNVVTKNNDTDDQNGHGTHMVGVLGATINNLVGIAGVTDLVNIMPISLVTPTGENEIASFDYVIRHRQEKDIKIILFALSRDTLVPGLADKIIRANKAGILVIVTAGNKGKDITKDKTYPCALTQKLTGMMCVAGTLQFENQLGRFSNFADYVDIAAPGDDIMTTGLEASYEFFTGTSPAASIVAGLAAMLYSVDPNLSPTAVKKIIEDTSQKGVKGSTRKSTFAFGRVDAGKALASLIPA